MNYHILQTNFCYCKSIFWESYQFIIEWSVLLKDYCKKMLTKSFFIYLYSFNIISLASEHDSVVMDVRQVAQRLVVQAQLCLSVLIMCIVSLDKALSLHRLVYPGEIELLHVKLCWQLICNRLGSHVGGVMTLIHFSPRDIKPALWV